MACANLCAAGLYSTASAATASAVCQACGGGSYSSAAGASACTACTTGGGAFGTALGLTASAQCLTCLPGYYYLNNACAVCAAGAYATGLNTGTCDRCPIGTFSTAAAANSSAQCRACGTGTFGVSDGASACWACDAGTFSAATAAQLNASAHVAAATPGPFVAYSRAKLAVGVGQYCSYYVSGPAATAAMCGPSADSLCSGLWGRTCPQPLAYNYTVCGITDVMYGQTICNMYSRNQRSCPWNVNEGCNMLTASDPAFVDPACFTACNGFIGGVSSWICDQGCAEVSPCTNGDSNGRYIGAGFTTADSCPVACNPGYAVSPDGTACVCSSVWGCAQGASPCLGCPAGTYAAAAGASVCVGCASGSYAAESGSSRCSLCPAGGYAAVVVGCGLCGAGTYTSAAGASACVACAAGTYGSHANATANACVGCAAGTYAPAGASVCVGCPAHTSSAYGAAASLMDCACIDGYACVYVKRITVLLTLQNMTLAQFTPAVQANLVASVASAAHVPVSSVTLVSYAAAAAGRRRLMGAELMMRVRLTVLHADALDVRRAAIMMHRRAWASTVALVAVDVQWYAAPPSIRVLKKRLS